MIFVDFVLAMMFQESLIVYPEVSCFKRFLKPPCDQNIQTKIYNIFFDVSKLTKSGSKKANQSLESNSKPLLHNNFYRIMQDGLFDDGQRAPISQQSFIVCFWVDMLIDHC